MQSTLPKNTVSIDNICVSIADIDSSQINQILCDCSLAEIRFDRLNLDYIDLIDLFGKSNSLIGTYRKGEESELSRLKYLSEAILAGADYIDIDYNESSSFTDKLILLARHNKCKIIISYHNYNETPPLRKLCEIVESCKNRGADLVKVACEVKSSKDLILLSYLYQKYSNIISIGMGEESKTLRIMSPIFGAPFTYAYHHLSNATADGQMEINQLIEFYKSIDCYKE